MRPRILKHRDTEDTEDRKENPLGLEPRTIVLKTILCASPRPLFLCVFRLRTARTRREEKREMGVDTFLDAR